MDTFLDSQAFFVRNRLYYGHFLRFPSLICPQSALLRTLPFVTRPYLSVINLVTDTSFSSQAFFVRNQPCYGHFL
jgi:hypothetical protein